MRVAIYARVSTDVQEARGTIGSQIALLRERVAQEGHELVAEYTDDGFSGARLDRPGLDALRDAAEAGHIEGVWCLSPDRLARMYAYQVIVLDELALRWSRLFGQSEGRKKVYRDCEVKPSGTSYSLPVTVVEVHRESAISPRRSAMAGSVLTALATPLCQHARDTGAPWN